MKKQEALGKIKNIETSNIISQIDEPQKVVIPQFVADWIEWSKRSNWYLQDLFSCLEDGGELDDWTHDENDDLIPEKVDMITRAWFAYPNITVEKLYTVEIPNPNSDSLTVLEKFDDDTVVISQMDVFPVDWRNYSDYQLTEQEIRKDFEWAWQWAKEVE